MVVAIVTVTVNPAVDVSADVENVVPESKLRCTAPRYEPGGGGLNVARVIKELGGTALALWSQGGFTGELLAQLLDEAGVSHQPIAVRDSLRMNQTFYETTSGEQFRFCFPGPEISAEEKRQWMTALEALDPPPEWIVLSGSLAPGVDDDFYAQASRHCPASSRIALDTSGPALKSALENGRFFLVKPNLRELGQLFHQTLESDQAIEQASRQLIERGGVEVVVISLGAGGAVLVTAEETRHLRSPTVKIRSKVGAGDSMVAGIVWALSNNKSVEEALRWGVAAGAAAVMTPGTSLCLRADVERLLNEMK